MIRTTVKIEGMMCGMCEAHICDTIRKAVPSAKKVKASRAKKEGYVSIASLCLNAGKTFNAVRNDLVTGATISDHLTSHHRTYQNDDLCASCDQFTSPFRQFGVLLIHLLDRYKLCDLIFNLLLGFAILDLW